MTCHAITRKRILHIVLVQTAYALAARHCYFTSYARFMNRCSLSYRGLVVAILPRSALLPDRCLSLILLVLMLLVEKHLFDLS